MKALSSSLGDPRPKKGYMYRDKIQLILVAQQYNHIDEKATMYTLKFSHSVLITL